MTYETIDWRAEAIRFSWAFDLKGDCVFNPGLASKPIRQRLVEWRFNEAAEEYEEYHPETKNGTRLTVFVVPATLSEPQGLEISLSAKSPTFAAFTGPDDYVKCACIHLYEDGQIWVCPCSSTCVSELVRGLFHLNLLTAEVEAALDVSITDQQKLEWTLEREAHSK